MEIVVYWLFFLGCLHYAKSISAQAGTCTFRNLTCSCWSHYNGIHVDCSRRNLTSISALNSSVIWLDLSHNEISEIPPKFLPKHLIYLDLSWNQMKNVKQKSFNSLSEIRFLDLSHCDIKDVEKGSFGDLINLQHLNISFNRNLGFASLPNLTDGLNRTRISSLHLNGITCLTGAGTTLRRHHVGNLRGTNITELSLDNNRLEIIEPNVLQNLPKTLEIFSLALNGLKPAFYLIEYEFLTNLRVLNTSFQDHLPHCPECLSDRCRDKLDEQFVDTSSYTIDYDDPLSHMTFYMPHNLETWDASFSMMTLINANFSLIAPSLRNLYVQGNFIKSLAEHFRIKNNTISNLDLSKNLLYYVSAHSLQDFKHIKRLNISHNYLGKELKNDNDGKLFEYFGNLEVLDMSFNLISLLPKSILKNSKIIKYINVSNNMLSDWRVNLNGMSNLTSLDLSQNKFTTLVKNARIDIERAFQYSNLSLDLSKNEIACTCDNKDFLLWMVEYKQHFLNIDNYTCSLPENGFDFGKFERSVKLLSKSCISYVSLYVGCSVSLAVIFSFVTGSLLVKNKWKIRYIVYKVKQKLKLVNHPNISGSTCVQYEHDVFLSYSGCSLMFVLNEVIPRLEQNRNMKLIIRDRDFLPGFTKTDNIMYSLQESRKTVCIVSKKYLESTWRDYELNMAKIEGIIDRGRLDFVILILLPEVYSNIYPSKIIDLVKRHCYIEYPEEACACDDFWEKLVDMIES